MTRCPVATGTDRSLSSGVSRSRGNTGPRLIALLWDFIENGGSSYGLSFFRPAGESAGRSSGLGRPAQAILGLQADKQMLLGASKNWWRTSAPGHEYEICREIYRSHATAKPAAAAIKKQGRHDPLLRNRVVDRPFFAQCEIEAETPERLSLSREANPRR